jgi:hypothetical protein
MSFAKMQTPQTVRDSCLLTDADFETIREGEGGQVSLGLEPDAEEVQSCTVLYSTVLCCAVQYSTAVQCRSVLYASISTTYAATECAWRTHLISRTGRLPRLSVREIYW